LRRPWIGVMLWTWLSIMSPHRYTWGIAYSAPLAAAAAACTVMGLLMTRERSSPFKGSPVRWFFAFMIWMTLCWVVGLDPSGDYEQWKKVMKIDVMLLVSLMLLHSRLHIMSLMWVCAGSLALLGSKGGIFTITGGGAERVYGPPGSFIAENNSFALALITIIPLLRFLHLHVQHRVARLGLMAAMLLCAASALGSHSRGALVGISAMALTLWWRGRNKLRDGILLVFVAFALVGFMPEKWSTRMSTIEDYADDSSAMGRINAWWAAWNMARHYPFGVGFNTSTPELFARFAPFPKDIHAAHSVFFQVLGEHGFIGLFLYLGMWLMTWRAAGWLRKQGNLVPEAKWAGDLGAMCQVALIGYFAGGAFLSLAYFDLPYDIMAMVVLTKLWVEKQGWKSEPVDSPKWMSWLGLVQAKKAD
jgi:putative inorganic carbon (HCO3(-)) transporter